MSIPDLHAAGAPRSHHAWLMEALGTLPSAAGHSPLTSLPEDLAEAWRVARTSAGVPGAVLAGAVATLTGRPVADFTRVEPRALRMLPERVARRYAVVPLSLRASSIVLASADPFGLLAERDLEFATGRQVEFEVADPDDIASQLDAAYSPDRAADAVAESLSGSDASVELEEDIDRPARGDAADSTEAVRRLAATLLRDAVEQGASDIHLAQSGGVGAVRYRVDGIMRPVLTMPAAVYARVVSRLKVIGKLDIADHQRPQDGRSQVRLNGRAVDLRISSLPVEGGAERLVLRLLEQGSIQSLDAIDITEPERSQLLALMGSAHGLVLLTGPTGSGKTTTLHAALRQRISPDVTIMTVENPVEYRVKGISQVQVEPKQGLTFSAALRAILRQDPDIILVGEIRDGETAETAAQAALTGHLVLSTVHAEDATSAMLRLRDLGLPSDSLAESFRGAAAQRLLRRLCPDCKAPSDPATFGDAERRFSEMTGRAPAMRAVGCQACHFTGYRGRLPIHQVFTMTPEIAAMVKSNLDLAALRAAARATGMRSLGESARDRIDAGVCTPDEAVRVLGTQFWEELSGAPAVPTLAAEQSSDEESRDEELRNDVAEVDQLAALLQRELTAPDTVLVFATDADVLASLAEGASRSGAMVLRASTVAEAARHTRETPGIRLLVLHLGPGLHKAPENAVGLLVDLRRALGQLTIPVLLLAPEGNAFIPPLLEAAGVVDYLTMPVPGDVLAARIRASLRRTQEFRAIDA